MCIIAFLVEMIIDICHTTKKMENMIMYIRIKIIMDIQHIQVVGNKEILKILNKCKSILGIWDVQ